MTYDDAITRAHQAALDPFRHWNKLEDEIAAQPPNWIHAIMALALVEHRRAYHDAAMVLLTMTDYALNPAK